MEASEEESTNSKNYYGPWMIGYRRILTSAVSGVNQLFLEDLYLKSRIQISLKWIGQISKRETLATDSNIFHFTSSIIILIECQVYGSTCYYRKLIHLNYVELIGVICFYKKMVSFKDCKYYEFLTDRHLYFIIIPKDNFSLISIILFFLNRLNSIKDFFAFLSY